MPTNDARHLSESRLAQLSEATRRGCADCPVVTAERGPGCGWCAARTPCGHPEYKRRFVICAETEESESNVQ